MKKQPDEAILSFNVAAKVKPKSSRRKIVMEPDGSLKVFLHSPPEDGRANSELKETLGRALRISQSSVEIVAGLKSRIKTLRISGLSRGEMNRILGSGGAG